jgi:hypothetical protein
MKNCCNIFFYFLVLKLLTYYKETKEQEPHQYDAAPQQ